MKISSPSYPSYYFPLMGCALEIIGLEGKVLTWAYLL